MADQIGILYSMATGVVLRTINPDSGFPTHLDQVDLNKPPGTALLRIDKVRVGADDKNMPNLDVLIPYVQKNHAIALSYGINCVVVDKNNIVVESVLCCPALYQTKLLNDVSKSGLTANTLVQRLNAAVGDIYNPLTNTVTSPFKAGIVST